MAKKQITEKQITELTTLQICNELKIVGYYRKFVYDKYKGQKFSLKEWKSNLSKDGLEIK
jgi:hypothetical protein